MIKVEEAAYAAGLLDGEGTIHIGGYGERVNLQIAIVNTNHFVLDWLQARWGGSIYEMRGNIRLHHDWSRCWSWTLNNRAVKRAFLEATLPYLIIKRRQAELGLAFLSIPTQPPGRKVLAPDILAQRRALLDQYRAARLGVDSPPVEVEVNDDQLAMELAR